MIDRYWNVVASNGALPELLEGVSPTLLRPPVNIARVVLHPEGFGERLLNRSIWRARLLGQMRRRLRLAVTLLLRLCWKKHCPIRMQTPAT